MAGSDSRLKLDTTAFASDADGDSLTYRHEWAVNGKPVPSAQGQARLTTPTLHKHDTVRVVVTYPAGSLSGFNLPGFESLVPATITATVQMRGEWP